jgi:hypothetical protein
MNREKRTCCNCDTDFKNGLGYFLSGHRWICNKCWEAVKKMMPHERPVPNRFVADDDRGPVIGEVKPDPPRPKKPPPPKPKPEDVGPIRDEDIPF